MKHLMRIFLLFIVCYANEVAWAQTITVAMTGIVDGSLRKQDLNSLLIANLESSDYTVFITHSIYAEGSLIYQRQSNAIVLQAMSNKHVNFHNTTSAENFYTSRGQFFRSYSRLPSGKYLIETTVQDDTGLRLGTETAEVQVRPEQPPQLSYPFDEEQIHTLNPLLRWIPPQPIQGTVYYNLKLVEVKSKQHPIKALFQNPALIDLQRLTSLQQPYAPQFHGLEYDHTYAWKIEAYDAENVFLGETDVWTFTPIQEKIEESKDTPVHIFSSHWLTQDGDGGGFFQADSLLRFTFDNRYGEDSLRYNIVTLDQQVVTTVLPIVKLTPGLNYLDLPVKNMPLTQDMYYQLVITSADGVQKQIKFIKK